MVKNHHPRRGSMQFWPRKRSKHSLVRIRSWATESKVKSLGFIGYKAGMVHVMAKDNRAKSLTKGETISLPVTIIDCPPMSVVGVNYYKRSMFGVKKVKSVMAPKLDKELSRVINVTKVAKAKLEDVGDFDDIRILVHTNPKQTTTGNKKPKLLEMALGGSKDDKINFAKENLGKTISVADVFEKGIMVDVHGVTKGKGFAGTVKRYGVAIRQHKGEKVKRGIGNLGAWTPKRVLYSVPQPGKMGFHLRTEYNKQILGLGENGSELVPKGGVAHYGKLDNNYLLIYGSVAGPRKGAIVLTAATRSNKKYQKDAYSVTKIIK
jgi:large subunit ribosomal protein L3